MTNWSGNITGRGTDQLLIGDSTKTGLTAAQLSKIHFQGFHTGAALVHGGNGEVVPPTPRHSCEAILIRTTTSTTPMWRC